MCFRLLRHLMNKNARNCCKFPFSNTSIGFLFFAVCFFLQNLSFSRFVIEYILEKFIKLSATRVHARVENRIILKLYTYCPIIHSGFSIFASVDFSFFFHPHISHNSYAYQHLYTRKRAHTYKHP
jgi:hypothetical protein